jgi:hypothetical protein
MDIRNGKRCGSQPDSFEKIPTIEGAFHEKYVSSAIPNVKFPFAAVIDPYVRGNI